MFILTAGKLTLVGIEVDWGSSLACRVHLTAGICGTH